MKIVLRVSLFLVLSCSAVCAESSPDSSHDVRVFHEIVNDASAPGTVIYHVSVAWPDEGKRMKVIPPTVPVPHGVTLNNVSTETTRVLTDAGSRKVRHFRHSIVADADGEYVITGAVIQYYFGVNEAPITRTLPTISFSVDLPMRVVGIGGVDIRIFVAAVIVVLLFVFMGVFFRLFRRSSTVSISPAHAALAQFSRVREIFQSGDYPRAILEMDQLLRSYLKENYSVEIQNSATVEEMSVMPEFEHFDTDALRVFYRVFSRAHEVRYGGAEMACQRHDVRMVMDDVRVILEKEQ